MALTAKLVEKVVNLVLGLVTLANISCVAVARHFPC